MTLHAIMMVDFQELVDINPGNCTLEEYLYIAHLIRGFRPGNVLVFGTGYDSAYWIEINHGGQTYFLEDNLQWINFTKNECPDANVIPVKYPTKRKQWRKLIHLPEKLLMNLPDSIVKMNWDLIFVDAPKGSNRKTPGRMQSIYSASQLNYKHFLLHDCNRTVEQVYFQEFVGKPDHIIGKLFHKAKTHSGIDGIDLD